MTELSQMSQEIISEGNTKPLRSRSRRWSFTLNNYDEKEFVSLITCFKDEKYILGKEIGKENNTPHIQGYVEFANQKDLSCLKKINKKIHWEKSKGNQKQNIEYCSKEGNYETNFKLPKPIKILSELREWQKEVENLIKMEPDDRTIHWYYDQIGGKGKTALCKYLCVKYNALYLTGKSADMKYGITQYLDAGNNPEIVLIDLTRSVESFVSYQGIEEIKNGIFYNTKYESKMILFNSPHIIVFSNFMPEESKLSADRWNITILE